MGSATVLAALMLFATPSSLASQPVTPELIEDILDDSYQTQLPDPDNDETEVAPTWLVSLLVGVAPLVRIAVVLGFIISLVLLVFWLAPGLMPRSSEPRGDGDEAGATPNGVPHLVHLQDVESLAREGRYAEAIHQLLMVVVQTLQQRFPLGVALTSREILAASSLSPDQSAALRDIVGAVEKSHFGGRGVTRDIFARCMESYRQLNLDAGSSPDQGSTS